MMNYDDDNDEIWNIELGKNIWHLYFERCVQIDKQKVYIHFEDWLSSTWFTFTRCMLLGYQPEKLF